MAACSRSATTRSTPRRCRRTASRRSICWWSISIRSRRPSRSGADFDDLHREHRHRRPGHDPRRGQEPRRRRGRRRSGRLRARARRTRTATTARPRWRCARKLAAKAYARTAAYDAAISNWFARRARRAGAGLSRVRRQARRSAALRREPAPVGGVLPHAGSARRRRHRAAGAGQAALLQQHQRHRRGL